MLTYAQENLAFVANLDYTPSSGRSKYIVEMENVLIPLSPLAVVLIGAIVLSPSNVLCVIPGLSFVLFVTGYTLIAALSTKNDQLDGIERVALDFGLSVAVVPLIGAIT